MKKITIGICCYNEESNIEAMYEAVTKQMEKFPAYDYEILFEDNASTDGSEAILEKIVQRDSHVRAIINQANYGIERSAFNCMKNAAGDAFISIPCDFQEPPDLIPEFIRGWEEGHDLVLGQKKGSEEGRIKYSLRSLYYAIIHWFSEGDQLEHVTGFGIYDRRVMDVLSEIRQYDPNLLARYLVCEYGFDIKLISYQQHERLRGKSSFTLSTYLDFSIDSLCQVSMKPLRLITLFGLFSSCIVFVALVVSFFAGVIAYSMLFAILLAIAIQIFCLGILGEYMAVILRKVTKKPLVIEKKRMPNDWV
ncbi:glycosyltransferase family 2 protein [Eggerthella sp. YY7918]|uniref:glycosyltransferase family 2 protein n=1 Tax=Eggerthella sp. (strain YY7918) TaxID=502558 RepID=UPI00021712F1|nr:glycosyltransferase family 2 protein [Eggerthella sp. YY7918]BAK44792.1 hypothetical protein EGYY_16520 [Eggerthella sp. YY7918]